MMDFRGAPPLTNRGGTNSLLGLPFGVALDWVTCTYQVHLADPEHVKARLLKLVGKVFRNRPPGASGPDFIERGKENGGRRNGFENLWAVSLNGSQILSFAWGGNRGWAALEFRGAICSLIPPADWLRLKRFCKRVQARITRCDIAADYYLGKFETGSGRWLIVTPTELENAWHRDPSTVVNNRGSSPRAYPRDEGNGRSFYIGARTSSREICCYEKSAQLAAKARGDKEASPDYVYSTDFPDWCRVELRLRRDGEKFIVPYDVLDYENWWEYIAGIGPWFAARVPVEKKKVIKYQPRRLHVEFNQLVRKQIMHLKENYGKFLYFLGLAVGPDLAYKVLLNESEEWPQLQRFPGWRTDSAFMELLSSSMLELLPASMNEGYRHRENKRLAALRSYLASKAGECFAKGFNGWRLRDYGTFHAVAPVTCFYPQRRIDNVSW